MKTSHLQCWVGLLLTLNGLVATIAGTQEPWTVTITPTMNPLPIGFCAAVHLNVTDRNGERPRNPAEIGVALADFDMSVTSPATRARAVVGKQDGPSSWGVCGCQAGVVGEVATITASYPSARLRSEQREPGVAFKTTTTFTLAAAKGSVDPPGCGSPVPATIAAVTAPIAAVSATLVGPPPTAVIVTGTPMLARVAWKSVGASSYSVQRWMQNDPACCRASSPQLGATATGWEDPLPLAGTGALDIRGQRQLYIYRVTAIYPDGRQGFVDINFARPEPTNPAVLTARKVSASWIPLANAFVPGYCKVTVGVAWSKVPGAAYYVLWGPGQLLTGRRLNNTTKRSNEEIHQTSVQIQGWTSLGAEYAPNPKWGWNTWTVAAFFLPGPVSTDAASFTKGSLNLKTGPPSLFNPHC